MKKDHKITILIALLLLIASYWLITLEITAFNQAVAQVEPIFTQFIEGTNKAQISVPKLTTIQDIDAIFGSQARLATAIFTAESHLNCQAVSSTGDIGIAQINHAAHPDIAVSSLLDCHNNLMEAYKIYSQQHNFSAWSAYKNGSYKQFLH